MADVFIMVYGTGVRECVRVQAQGNVAIVHFTIHRIIKKRHASLM